MPLGQRAALFTVGLVAATASAAAVLVIDHLPDHEAGSRVAVMPAPDLRETAVDMESEVNRLFRGRNAFELSDGALADVERTIGRLRYMAETLREVERAQRRVAYLQAAE